MAKKEHVPETRAVKPNREQRRHPERLEAAENEGLSRDERPPQDQAPPVPETRAENRDPKKKTADTWNQ